MAKLPTKPQATFPMLMIVLGLSVGLTRCTSDEPPILEDNLRYKQANAGQTIGVNSDGKLVVETKTTAEAELILQELANERLLESVHNESHLLENCRKTLADPRFGGAGKLGQTPNLEDYRPVADTMQEFGLDENGQLVVKKTQDYMEQLKKNRHYHATLRKVAQEVVKMRKSCEYKLQTVRAAGNSEATQTF